MIKIYGFAKAYNAGVKIARVLEIIFISRVEFTKL
mgnify:CR=1 FL=1